MKPTDVTLALDTLVQTGLPGFLWGSPGIGKSDLVRQTAERHGLQLIDVRAVLLDPVDLRGLPRINGDNKAHWCAPDFLPTAGAGILFLDELNAAPPLVQAACYQLVLDRKLGEYSLPADWRIVAAGNRETDRAVTSRMPSALANRFIHISVDTDLQDWVSWALSAGIQTEVIAFLRFRPGLLHAFDPARNDKAFPTPRSWAFVSSILAGNPAEAIRHELLSGTVGEGAATEFVAFLRICHSLPSPDAVLMNPGTAEVPTDPATLYALTGALARKASANTMDSLMTYAGRMPAEFSVLLVKDILRSDPQLANTRAYIDWAANHAEVLI